MHGIRCGPAIEQVAPAKAFEDVAIVRALDDIVERRGANVFERANQSHSVSASVGDLLAC